MVPGRCRNIVFIPVYHDPFRTGNDLKRFAIAMKNAGGGRACCAPGTEHVDTFWSAVDCVQARISSLAEQLFGFDGFVDVRLQRFPSRR
jgi:hypothetical protein